MEDREQERMALSIDEVTSATGLGRTFIYGEISAGKLLAHKAGRRTIVLKRNLAAYLEGLPGPTTPSPDTKRAR
jgi:excisionase family DNA binding protein